MRPHHLRLRAFGPFSGEVEVDLDRLAASGLFLLHGPTGAGKTTLLDALGFALYGRVPGLRGRTGRLRSDHADETVRTEVELEVTLAGRRWRITRSPAQERAKARGTGTTTEQARVLLERHDGGTWVTVSTRIDEAAAELDPLLGISADQFFQVVLLPQGEFARFLRADSKERGELLQRLFATQRFRAVEEWLAGHRASTAATVGQARQELAVLAARLAQASGTPVPEVVEPGWGAGLLASAEQDLEAAAQAAGTAAAQRDAARGRAEQQVRLADLQLRRRAAQSAARRLDDARRGHDELGRELADASRAAELASVLDEAAAREQAHRAATTAEAAARARLAAAGLPLDAPLSVLRAAGEAARRRTGLLDALRDTAAALDDERAHVCVAEAEAVTADDALATLQVGLATLPARRDLAEAEVATARESAAQLPSARALVPALQAALGEAVALADCEAALRSLDEEHLRAREALVALREREGELREARLVSMVAELADRLVDGAPCEVCGATRHPDPYEGQGDGVTREDEERARERAEQAARELASVEARNAVSRAAATGHRERLAAAGRPGATALHLRELCAAAGSACAELEGLAAGLTSAAQALAAVEREQAQAGATGVRLDGERAAARRRAQDAQARAERLSARLDAELGDDPDLATALVRTAERAAACDTALDACEAAERAGADAVRTAGAALRAVQDARFVDVAGARAALRPAAWRADAERRRRAHDDHRAAVEAALAEPELQVPLEPAADPAAATAALRQADRALTVAGAVETEASGRVRQLVGLVAQLRDALAALAPLDLRATQARRLADLCAGAGSNALRMTLTSFVLAARLEEVAAVASARLLQMSQGRYRLVHTDGAARGGARSGLGLLVRDAWTGQDRDTATLSGGETFLASLSLALGLADVVQAESGGTRIEALFVDEGFGTLDEETLDEVMDVLDGLREGGRLVGLVSHVAELRDRIPAQVRVVKRQTGSDLEVIGC